MTLNLTKPAGEHTGEERAAIFRNLTTEIFRGLRKDTGKLSSYQASYARGRAMKLMLEAGF